MTSTATARSFPHRPAGHCGSGALRDLLELHGLDYGAGPLSEGAVFGLGGGLGFLYLETPGMTPPVYVVGRGADLERDIAEHLGLGLEVRDTDDPTTGWRWVRDEIDAGRPPMVWADIGHLDYLRVRMHNTRHDIVVVGYDDAEDVAWVADNDREELQPCSLESLARARNSDAFPGPNRHTTFIYQWPEQLRPAGEATHRALRQAVSNMRDGGEPLAGLCGAFGLSGIDAFATRYPGWPATFGDELAGALKGLHVFIVKAGTAGAMFRSLHATFLDDMAELLNDARLRVLAATYDTLADSWRELADLAACQDHGAGLDVVQRIRSLEHRGVSLTEAWLAQNG
ncbi:MAG: BtrH N-terminal domain-containing protein [Solirubrobacterales bacterium]|nr:BtrH N-terminal domain-containing protein [Solirubrobacterales bacterium]